MTPRLLFPVLFLLISFLATSCTGYVPKNCYDDIRWDADRDMVPGPLSNPFRYGKPDWCDDGPLPWP